MIDKSDNAFMGPFEGGFTKSNAPQSYLLYDARLIMKVHTLKFDPKSSNYYFSGWWGREEEHCLHAFNTGM